MKLTRFFVDGETRIGIVEEDIVRDATTDVDSFRAALETITAGAGIEATGETYQTSDITFLPPTMPSNTTFAVALNYQAHIEETSRDVPEWPLIFLKMYRSLTGHLEPIPRYTGITNELDYEAELAVVIGAPTWQVSEAEALDYVAGYTILNDITARDLQTVPVGEGGYLDWFSSKALEKSTPVGPHIVSADEIDDPMDLQITSRVNGETMQDESSGLMIRGVSELIAFASSRVELQPGDLIATGTPEGVGLFQDLLLEEGDTVEIDVEGIGTLSNTVRDAT